MRPNTRLVLSVVLLAASLCAGRAESACTYSVGDDAVKVEWTAFKFTAKQGVTGSFNTAKLEGPKEASSLVRLAEGLSMEIDGASIESGNPGRNATISQFFFQQFTPSPTITGKVESVEGNDESGTLQVAITMNGTTRTVPFAYTISEANEVEAKATIDLMDFAMQKPFETLHQACEEQHIGEDGVSKTWTEVGLRLTGKFAETCA
jgi:polyisoprenoid-binding protein YceI